MGLSDRPNHVILFGVLLACLVVRVFADGDKYEGKWISEVRFDGNRNFPDKELLEVFYFEDDVAGRVNRLFVYSYSQTLPYVLKQDLLKFYRQRGYLKAVIDEPRIEVDGERLKVTIPIEEGVRYRLGDLKISGLKRGSQVEIERILGVKKGEIVDWVRLNNAVYEVLPKLLGSRGLAFAMAEIENIEIHPPSKKESEGSVDFELVIDEGPTYRVKEVDVVGDADPALVRSFLTFKEGDPFRRAKIEESIKILNDSQLFRHVDFTGDVEIREIGPLHDDDVRTKDGSEAKLLKKPSEAIAELLKRQLSISLRVNRATSVGIGTYHVGSVSFTGNRALSDLELIEAFGLQKGSYFDPTLFIQNVRHFNSTGRYKPIIENDIDFELGEEGTHDDSTSGLINVKIKIVEL